MKIVVKEKIKDGITFPCFRKGSTSGIVYFFTTSTKSGISIDGNNLADLIATQPIVGTITITQD